MEMIIESRAEKEQNSKRSFGVNLSVQELLGLSDEDVLGFIDREVKSDFHDDVVTEFNTLVESNYFILTSQVTVQCPSTEVKPNGETFTTDYFTLFSDPETAACIIDQS